MAPSSSLSISANTSRTSVLPFMCGVSSMDIQIQRSTASLQRRGDTEKNRNGNDMTKCAKLAACPKRFRSVAGGQWSFFLLLPSLCLGVSVVREVALVFSHALRLGLGCHLTVPFLAHVGNEFADAIGKLDHFAVTLQIELDFVVPSGGVIDGSRQVGKGPNDLAGQNETHEDAEDQSKGRNDQ